MTLIEQINTDALRVILNEVKNPLNKAILWDKSVSSACYENIICENLLNLRHLRSNKYHQRKSD